MLTFGTLADWLALIAVIASSVFYLIAGQSARVCNPTGPERSLNRRMILFGRIAFVAAASWILVAVAVLGTLLVTHRFDSARLNAGKRALQILETRYSFQGSPCMAPAQ